MENKNPQWEKVTEDVGADTYRLEVPGGWIYRSREYHPDEGLPVTAISMVFVPS